MKIRPHPYQQQIFEASRSALAEHKAICIEAPTGAGKSVILAKIVHAVDGLNRRRGTDNAVYLVADKLHLVEQLSRHLAEFDISHSIITGGRFESSLSLYSVCTIQTLARRELKKNPALIIFDEAHHQSPSVKTLSDMYPDAKIIGVTASPELLSGKGLSTCSDPPGIYNKLITCPLTMRELTELGYLTKIRYFAPPMRGLDTVKIVAGEYHIQQVEELIKKRGIYGDAIKHYEKITAQTGDGPTIVFCRSVASCYTFCDDLISHGHPAAVLEGSQGKRERRAILDAFKSGNIKFLVTCRLVLEGFDMPDCRIALDLSPTCSRALWRQKVGRIARRADNKEEAIYIDCVGGISQHTSSGDVYEVFDWRFNGREYNKVIISKTAEDRYCESCYQYIEPGNSSCPFCGAKKQKSTPKKQPEKMDGELVEITAEEVRELGGLRSKKVQEAISAAIRDENIDILLSIARGHFWAAPAKIPFWVYYKIRKSRPGTVDIEALHKIRRHVNYRPGWVKYAAQIIRRSQ